MAGTKTLDLDVVQLRPQATPPASPSKGWTYVDSATGHSWTYNGSTWVDNGTGGGGGGSTPPTSVSLAFTDGLATVAHSGATTSQKVVAARDGESDEADMDPLFISAWVSASNIVSVRAHTASGLTFTGTAVINYTIG